MQWKGVCSKYWGEYPKQKLVSNGVGIDKDGTVIKAGVFGTFPMMVLYKLYINFICIEQASHVYISKFILDKQNLSNSSSFETLQRF